MQSMSIPLMNILNLPRAFWSAIHGGAIVQTLALKIPHAGEGDCAGGHRSKIEVLPAMLEGVQKNFKDTVLMMTRYAFSRKAPQ